MYVCEKKSTHLYEVVYNDDGYHDREEYRCTVADHNQNTNNCGKLQ